MRLVDKHGVSEEQIQQSILQGLTAYGYIVFSTSRRVKRCRNCGRWPGSGGDGVTQGLPDLIVTRESWDGVLLGIEVKGPKTRISTEQKELVEGNVIMFVRSWDEACFAVCAFEQRHGLNGPISKRLSNKEALGG